MNRMISRPLTFLTTENTKTTDFGHDKIRAKYPCHLWLNGQKDAAQICSFCLKIISPEWVWQARLEFVAF